MNYPFSAQPKWFTSSSHSKFKATLLGMAVIVVSLCFSHSAPAIDRMRLLRKTFHKAPFVSQQTRLPSASEEAIRGSESIIDLFEFGATWVPFGPNPIPHRQNLLPRLPL